MSKITSPHDAFFRHAMADSRVAREFFTQHLPETIKKQVNLKSLNLCPASYVDNTLRLSISDILYSADFQGTPGYLYLLCEHQSSPDKLMPFRILQYTCAIMADHLKQTGTETLPLVYPMVFYNGKVKYPYSSDIRALISAPAELVEAILFKPFQLIDTHALKDEELKRYHWSGILAFFMKHIFARDIVPYVQEVMDVLRALEQEGGQEYIITLLHYLLAAGETPRPKAFMAAIKEGLSSPLEETLMTIAEQLKTQALHEGLLKGRVEGKAEGKAEALQQVAVAIQLLKAGNARKVIADQTGLSLTEIEALEKSLLH